MCFTSMANMEREIQEPSSKGMKQQDGVLYEPSFDTVAIYLILNILLFIHTSFILLNITQNIRGLIGMLRITYRKFHLHKVLFHFASRMLEGIHCIA